MHCRDQKAWLECYMEKFAEAKLAKSHHKEKVLSSIGPSYLQIQRRMFSVGHTQVAAKVLEEVWHSNICNC